MTPPRALLLDLDGTLLDTAPEMAAGLNILRAEQGREALPLATIRPTVSHGAARMISLAFPEANPEEHENLRLRFLEIYRGMIGTNTRLFEGFAEVFEVLEKARLAWGIVTNKPGWLTEPLLAALGLAPTHSCVVSGDTVAERKPHPLPMLHAAKLIQQPPESCLYVGDAERDIRAGRAAGMRTVVAGWGYLSDLDEPARWQADGYASHPRDLLSWLTFAPAVRVGPT